MVQHKQYSKKHTNSKYCVTRLAVDQYHPKRADNADFNHHTQQLIISHQKHSQNNVIHNIQSSQQLTKISRYKFHCYCTIKLEDWHKLMLTLTFSPLIQILIRIGSRSLDLHRDPDRQQNLVDWVLWPRPTVHTSKKFR